MAKLLQVLVDTSATATETFRIDGTPTDVAGPTATATYPDGSALAPAPTVQQVWEGRTTGQYRLAFSPQPEVTWLDYELSGTVGGGVQRLAGRVEWVGALLFTLTQLRALRVGNGRPFADATLWPNERIQAARTAALEEFQRILWYSPVPRYGREVISGDGDRSLQLAVYEVRRILAASIDGTALSASELADLHVKGRMLTRATLGRWSSGLGNVTVAYRHGLPDVPGDGGNMAMLWAAQRLDPAVFAEASSVVTPDGSSYQFDPAGQVTRAGSVRHTGIARVDAWLNRWKVA